MALDHMHARLAQLPQNLKRRAAPEPPIQRPDQAQSRQWRRKRASAISFAPQNGDRARRDLMMRQSRLRCRYVRLNKKKGSGVPRLRLRIKTSAKRKRPADVPASPRCTIRVASVAASATVPIAGMAHSEIVGGSVSRRDEVGGSKHQAQNGQGGECDCLHGILSSMSAQWRLVLLLRQSLRASADGWRVGGGWESGAEVFHTACRPGQSLPARVPIGTKKPPAASASCGPGTAAPCSQNGSGCGTG